MKAFEELFQEAALVADKRSKVLNELVVKTKEDILPKFCDACAGFGLSKIYIRTDSKVYSDSDKQSDERDYFYGLCINVEDREISDALYNPHSEYGYGEPAWRIPDHWNGEPISEAKLLKAGIVEFVKTLNARLEKYIKTYTDKNEQAERLLNSQE